MSCENLLRILFASHPTRSNLILTSICFMLGVVVRFSGFGFLPSSYASSPLYPIAIAAMT